MASTEAAHAPYGSWKSSISALDVSKEGSDGNFGDFSVDQVAEYQAREVFWVDVRPDADGRSILYSYDMATQTRRQWTPDGFSVRSLVHEYGGGSILVVRGCVFFSNMADQRLYRQTAPDAPPQPLTPAGKFHYADGCYDASRDRMFYVREDHSGADGEATTVIVQVDPNSGAARVVGHGADFYSSPRVSRDGRRLAWIEWSHPNMPWDDSRLMVVDLDADGLPAGEAKAIVQGGDGHPLSVLYPVWTADGSLIYAGDHEDFWDLYRVAADGSNRRRIFSRGTHDVVGPPWVFEYTCFWYRADSDTVAVNKVGEGLVEVRVSDGSQRRICAEADRAVLVRGAPGGRLFAVVHDFKSFPALLCVDAAAGQPVRELARSIDYCLAPGDVSVPRQIEFDTTDGAKAFAFYYPPKNSAVRTGCPSSGPPPPLIVQAHGGPTSCAVTCLRLSVQFWTSRGFALVDVDYRGSTGYGRPFRDALRGKWGVYDVEDCCAAVQYLVRENLADRERICIHGGSAGGFTTLACLAFREVFSAGASHYGVADLELLMAHTHKFESHYLESLIGPWPAARHLYQQRSPLHALDRFQSPVVFFQGDEDKVVPPEQARVMFEALRSKGIATALMMFPGEQHGFRKRAHIVRALEAELYFYAKVLGLQGVDGDGGLFSGEGLAIENLNVRTRRLTS